MKLVNGERCSDTKQAYAAKIGLPLVALAAVIAFTCAVFSQTSSDGTTNSVIDIFCTPDGKVHVNTQADPKSIDPRWDPSLFLSITLGFGSFSFAAAKGIDICWDLIVGRGGQIILAVLAYPVLRRSLSTYMEQRSVHYGVYASLAFDKISLITLYSIAQDLFRRPQTAGKWNRKRLPLLDLHFLGIALVLTYILAFPTMITVMTGYQATFTPLVTRPDNGFLMKASNLTKPHFVIVDGSRIGMQDFQPIYSGDPLTETLVAYSGTASYTINVEFTSCDWPFWQYCYPPKWFGYGTKLPPGLWYRPCVFWVQCGRPTLPWGHTAPMDWQSNGGQYTSSNITLDGKVWSLHAPPLNVITQMDSLIENNHINSIPPPTVNYLAYGNTALSSGYLKENSVCQPSDRYQWGFSSLLLLVFCLLTALFAFILNLLHLDAFWKSRTDRYRYNVNHYRDAVDLVHELVSKEFGTMIQNIPAKNLALELQRSNVEVSLDTDDLPLSRKEEQLSRRPKKGSSEKPDLADNGGISGALKDDSKDRSIMFHSFKSDSNTQGSEV